MHTTDVLILGGGLAGMQAALHLPEHRVTLATVGRVGRAGASPRAKGGVAAPVGGDDRPMLHARDTVEAGAGLCHHGAVQVATEEGARRVDELLELGVGFDRDVAGQLALGREAAHCRRRIVKAGGDTTGAAICKTVSRRLKAAGNVELLEDWRALRLLDDGERVVGALLEHADGRRRVVYARCTVLATGGLGQLYEFSSNPAEARGEGLMLALEAGAALADLEFVQFHPTALAVDANPQPLLTEAIRGEGARLVDHYGKRFMTGVHDLAELAPRDVVARAIWERLQVGGTVYLDATMLGEDFAARFPSAQQVCAEAGLDPTRDLLPVRPVAHYHMGGVAVDLDGRSTVEGLWACGEVAATGLHGANRLASNSLLEALVFGARAGLSVGRYLRYASPVPRPRPTPLDLAHPTTSRPDPDALAEVRRLMWCYVGLERIDAGLEAALSSLDRLAVNYRRDEATYRLISLASLVAIAAMQRRESRGAHYRADFPRPAATWRRRQIFTPQGVRAEHTHAERRFWAEEASRGLPF